MISKDKSSNTNNKLDKDKISKKIELDKNNGTKEDKYFIQPPSDSEDDICGPLKCDKEL